MNVPILMLGADYSQAFAPAMMGYDLAFEEKPTGTKDAKGRMIYADNSGSMEYPHLFVINPDTGMKAPIEGTPKAISPTTTTGKKYDDVLASILPFVKTGLENAPALIAAIRNKNPGMSEAEAAKIAQYGQQKNLLASSMPWIIIGGVGLVAVLLLVGTRKR